MRKQIIFYETPIRPVVCKAFENDHSIGAEWRFYYVLWSITGFESINSQKIDVTNKSMLKYGKMCP